MLRRAWRVHQIARSASATRTGRRWHSAGTAAAAADDEVVIVSGLPRGNPPRSLAYKLKELLGLRTTPTLLQRPASREALLLTHSDADARTVRRVCAATTGRAAARQPRPSRRPLELGLGPSIQLSLRSAAAAASLMGDPVDERPWGAHVMRPTADSSLAPGPPREQPPPPATTEASATAERVLRRGGTDPKGLTVALGGFDDHFEEGVYLCAGCHSPLYASSMKFSCGCGWPAFWDCVDGSMYERRDGARGELVCSCCGGHIGHIYRGEGFENPAPNERHCVNSSALVFQPEHIQMAAGAAGAAEAGAGAGAGEGLVRPGYAGGVYMASYTEDSDTIYEELEGASDAHDLIGSATVGRGGGQGRAFHGVARATCTPAPTPTGGGAGGDPQPAAESLEQDEQDEQEEELTLITLAPYVRGAEPAHIVSVAAAPKRLPQLGGGPGGLGSLSVGGGLEGLAAALAGPPQ